jgi:NADPH-dependent glutamate synthase beta subunit-like oxidoreductase
MNGQATCDGVKISSPLTGVKIERNELVDLPHVQGIGDDLRDLSRIVAYLHERDIDSVTYQDWKMLDQYEVASGSGQGRSRVKVTTVPEMMAVIHQGRIAGQ